MTITKYEDMRKRLRIRHELSLYYWGEGSIVEFREWPIYYLSKDETDIISICDGICSVEEVVAKVEKFDKKEQIVSIINELIQNRILILT